MARLGEIVCVRLQWPWRMRGNDLEVLLEVLMHCGEMSVEGSRHGELEHTHLRAKLWVGQRRGARIERAEACHMWLDAPAFPDQEVGRTQATVGAIGRNDPRMCLACLIDLKERKGFSQACKHKSNLNGKATPECWVRCARESAPLCCRPDKPLTG